MSSEPSPASVITVLVHRPGRMMALASGAALLLIGGLIISFQWGSGFGRGWWNLLLMIPAIVGFLAIMRTGTTRCEVHLDAERLVVRSVDSSQLLGSAREASYAWSDIVATSWVGDDSDQLRIDFATRPLALVFSGVRRDLDQLNAAAKSKHGT